MQIIIEQEKCKQFLDFFIGLIFILKEKFFEAEFGAQRE